MLSMLPMGGICAVSCKVVTMASDFLRGSVHPGVCAGLGLSCVIVLLLGANRTCDFLGSCALRVSMSLCSVHGRTFG